MHIKDRLARVQLVPDESHDVEMFETWQKGINKTAQREARLEVKQEIDRHESIVGKYKAEAETATANQSKVEAEKAMAEAFHKVSSDKFDRLEKNLATVKGNWEATKSALKQNSKDSESSKSKLIDEQLKVQELKIIVSSLEGKLSEARKKPAVVKPYLR